ncbi:MAG: hypothetical protein GY855_05795 [candidate division Zixibacteria bacterium]|nr:hypothetical protein [candidate division Zixibacteria bacterium]
MKNRQKGYTRSAFLVMFIIGIMIITGCGNQSPVSPVSDQASHQEPFDPSSIEGQWGRVLGFSMHDMEGGSAGLDGTAIDVSMLGYESKYVIPADAVGDPLDITCVPSNWLTSIGMIYIYDFGPDGTEFDVSTTLSLDMDALEDYNPNSKAFIGAELRLYNPNTGAWELQEIDTTIIDGKVEFNIDHYSRYGIGGRNN